MLSLFHFHSSDPFPALLSWILRRARIVSALAVLSLIILLSPPTLSLQAQVPDLQPRGYINDYAGVLSAAARQTLEALAAELDRKTGAQLAVVIVRSLDGEPIENYSIALTERWGIGRKEQGDTGVLLLLAIEDRQNRIEVGYGNEGIINDARVGDILRAMRPGLQQNDYDGAILLGTGQIAALIARDKGVTLQLGGQAAPSETRRSTRNPLRGLIRLIMFLGLGLLMFRPGRRRRGWYGPGVGTGLVMGGLMGAMLGGGMRGGYSGGGISSGGFGGFGGGGFGGGGASGSW